MVLRVSWNAFNKRIVHIDSSGCLQHAVAVIWFSFSQTCNVIQNIFVWKLHCVLEEVILRTIHFVGHSWDTIQIEWGIQNHLSYVNMDASNVCTKNVRFGNTVLCISCIQCMYTVYWNIKRMGKSRCKCFEKFAFSCAACSRNMLTVWIIVKLVEIVWISGWHLMTFLSKTVSAMEGHFTYVFSHMDHQQLEVRMCVRSES